MHNVCNRLVRLIDNSEADDKIIAVLEGDDVYGEITELADAPQGIIDRLRHYFLTYKEIPGKQGSPRIKIASFYDRKTAYGVIKQSRQDYRANYSPPGS